MVLQFLLPLLTGGGALGNRGSALGGLMQGGGFGLGYGFMVRAGYDLYGAIKDKVIGSLMGARYMPGTGASMMGTGGLMGMQHNPEHRGSVDTYSLQQLQNNPKFQAIQGSVGKTNALSAWKAHQRNIGKQSTTQGSRTIKIGNRVFTKKISPITGRLETDDQFHKRVGYTGRRQRDYNRKDFLSSMFRL